MHPQVKKLLSIPKIEQKTLEWYKARWNVVTASDFAQALGEGKFGTQKQFIEKKCKPLDTTDTGPTDNPFFKWGHMFEPVATSIYEKMHNKHVHEFGLLLHPRYDFFGASPDGITDDGIMLEIKCPFKRKLTGEIPVQYYYQIQGQLDVCDLDECDYLECVFELVDKEAFILNKTHIKGIIYGDSKYEYSDPIFPGEDIDNTIFKDSEIKYWILADKNLKRVKKDPLFLEEKMKELSKIWDKVLYYRTNKEAFEIEVLNKISIDTEPKKSPKHKSFKKDTCEDTGYMFLEISND